MVLVAKMFAASYSCLKGTADGRSGAREDFRFSVQVKSNVMREMPSDGEVRSDLARITAACQVWGVCSQT